MDGGFGWIIENDSNKLKWIAWYAFAWPICVPVDELKAAWAELQIARDYKLTKIIVQPILRMLRFW